MRIFPATLLGGFFVALAWALRLKPTHWVQMRERVSEAWPYCDRMSKWTGGDQ